mmetsp:Transcript_50502/g.117897  ORF Transcript_50502/g.117897 Transcript_50502/m.117897 type:complete len:295 (+) Transcript_50502:64-948(+)
MLSYKRHPRLPQEAVCAAVAVLCLAMCSWQSTQVGFAQLPSTVKARASAQPLGSRSPAAAQANTGAPNNQHTLGVAARAGLMLVFAAAIGRVPRSGLKRASAPISCRAFSVSCSAQLQHCGGSMAPTATSIATAMKAPAVVQLTAEPAANTISRGFEAFIGLHVPAALPNPGEKDASSMSGSRSKARLRAARIIGGVRHRARGATTRMAASATKQEHRRVGRLLQRATQKRAQGYGASYDSSLQRTVIQLGLQALQRSTCRKAMRASARKVCISEAADREWFCHKGFLPEKQHH